MELLGPRTHDPETRDRQYSWLAEIVKLAPGNVRYLRQCRENILGPSFTARDPEQISIACSTSGARHSTIASQIVATGPSEGIRGKPASWGCAYNCRDSLDLGIHRVTVDNDLRHDVVLAGRKPAVELDRKRQIFCWNGYAGKRDLAAGVHHHVPAFRGGAFANRHIGEPYRLPHNLIVAHKLHHDFDVGGEAQPALLSLDFRDVATAGDGIGVVGTDAQRIAQVTERLDADAFPRPTFELIRPIGDQEVAVAPVER